MTLKQISKTDRILLLKSGKGHLINDLYRLLNGNNILTW